MAADKLGPKVPAVTDRRYRRDVQVFAYGSPNASTLFFNLRSAVGT